MSWRAETHGAWIELIRHFLGRSFDSEMSRERGQWGTVAVSLFALAVPAAMLLLSTPPLPKGVIPATQVQTGFLGLVTFLMATTGMLALLSWDSLFPSQRDYLALAGLPVHSRQIFAARFVTVVLLAAAATAVVSLFPALSAKPPFTTVSARVMACATGCTFIFFAIVGLQGLLVNTLPAQRLGGIGALVQGGLMAICFLAGLYRWFIMEWTPATLARLPEFGAWAPPVWMLGVHQEWTGDPSRFYTAMAERGRLAAAASIGFAVLMYAVASIRYRRLLLESPEGGGAPVRSWSVLRRLARNPRQAAILQFLAIVLTRSRVHRLVMMAYAGAGLAVMINSLLIVGMATKWVGGWRTMLQFVVLYWPLGLMLVAVAGVRHAFQMPAEWGANWIFRMTETEGRRDWMLAVERFVLVCVVTPIQLAALVLGTAILGAPVALRMALLQYMVALLAFELLFHSWQQLPFTCSYVPERNSLMSLMAAWLVVLVIVAPLLSLGIAEVSRRWWMFLLVFPAGAAAWCWAFRRRREGWGEAPLAYDDMSEAVLHLGIREMSFSDAPAPRRAEEFWEPVADGVRTRYTPRAGGDGWQRFAAGWGQDARYALRMLAASPGYAAVAVISLSLGICVATSAFSELNAVVLRDLPGVPDPEQLAALQAPGSFPQFQALRARTDLLVSAFAYVAPVPFGVAVDGRTERTWGHLVTPTYFTTLDVKPAIGRVFDDAHEHSGAAPAVVVSYRFWQNRMGGDPAAVGRMLRVNGTACTILGVGPREFLGASPMYFPADLWLPVTVDALVTPELADHALDRRDVNMFRMAMRLRRGITRARAEAELDTVARQLEQAYGEEDARLKGRRLVLVPGGKTAPIRSQDVPMVTVLPMVLVGLILLIACSNVANMTLARAGARRRQIAVRLALGASRWRVIRQLMTESLLLASGAGALGFLLTVWLMRVLSGLRVPFPMPVQYDFSPDGRVLAFTLVLVVVTALAFGLAPALQATRADLTPALKEGGNVHLRRYRRLSLRNLLVLSQLAGSLTLLLITGFLVLGFQRTTGIEVGFNPRNLWVISVDPVRDGYTGPQAAEFFRKLMDRVRTMPAISSATLTDTVPMSGGGFGSVALSIAGTDGGRLIHTAVKYVVDKEYFETIGIPILQGRAFRQEDEANESRAVIVSEELTQQFWQGENSLGRPIEIGGGEVGPGKNKLDPLGSIDHRPPARGRQAFEVVGVVKGIKQGFGLEKPRPAIYFPLRASDYARPSLQGVTLMLRTAPGVDAIGAVRREIAAMDPRLSPFNAHGMPEQLDNLMFLIQTVVWMYGSIGLFGLVLAAVGLAGVTAYSVTQRAREIGIRIALGASRGDVLGLVMKEGAVMVGLGTAVGLSLAWASNRLLAAFLNAMARSTSTATSDPLLLVGAPLLLAGLALAACYLPARRSTRIDPAVALRSE